VKLAFWFTRVLRAVGVAVAIGVLILYLTNPQQRFALWAFDWQAAGAIATAFAAAYAAIAAHEARRSADIALQIDRNQATRAQERRRDRAIAMSVALDHEFRRLSRHMRVLAQDMEVDAELVEAMYLDSRRAMGSVSFPVLRAFVEKADDFDRQTSATLTLTLANLMQLESIPEVRERTHPQMLFAIRMMMRNAKAARHSIVQARLGLRPYYKNVMHWERFD
jgi:hypothetical protein